MLATGWEYLLVAAWPPYGVIGSVLWTRGLPVPEACKDFIRRCRKLWEKIFDAYQHPWNTTTDHSIVGIVTLSSIRLEWFRFCIMHFAGWGRVLPEYVRIFRLPVYRKR
jgi:hypothetical protein